MNSSGDERCLNCPPTTAAHVSRLSGRRVLVIGDLFLDEYIEGRATRLSREAPVPVLEFERRFYRPGGGANPAQNVVSLGGKAVQVGVVGDDAAGRQLVSELQAAGIDPAGVVVDPTRPTTTKTRIISRGSLRFPQQLARVDRLDRRPIDAETVTAISAHIQSLASDVDAILVSDYRTGVVTPATIATALDVARASQRLLTVDSQGNLRRYLGFDVVKCNQTEAQATLGYSLDDPQAIESACQRLVEELGSQVIVITRGASGMAGLSREAGFVTLAAANQSEVYDVVGAGDTVIAVLTMALVAGLPFRIALWLANYAAGLVVRKLGNATTTQQELCWAIEHW